MSAQHRYTGMRSPLEHKIVELFERAREPLYPKQVATRLRYGAQTCQTALGGMYVAGVLKRRKSWAPQRPYEYMLASQPWPEEKRGEVRAP